jgi:ABC-type sugar transport system ATPase subunit
MCDRIIIMKNGVISGELARDERLNEEDLIVKMV